MKRGSLSCLIVTAILNGGCGDDGAPSEATTERQDALSFHRPSVLTQHNDNARTGANLRERALTPNEVVKGFGKLYSLPIRGSAYAQPLYVPSLWIPRKGVRNVLLVATMHNTIYAFDADDPTQTAPLWERQLEPSVPLPDPIIGRACGEYRDISGEIGIASTPVVDPSCGTMYLVTATGGGTSYAHYLHAVDIQTGHDKRPPVRVQATVPGKNSDGSNKSITFQSEYENQRPALLLENGRVYIAFGAYCDTGNYYGWLFAYDQHSLARTAVYNTARDGWGAGVWMGGGGPAADRHGNLYVTTGNGTANLHSGGQSAGHAFLKLNRNLRVLDWFIPFNYEHLNNTDNDLGSSGPMLVPGSELVVSGGKEGRLYVLDHDDLGRHQADADSQIVQSFLVAPQDGSEHHIRGGTVYWSGPQGPTVYTWAVNDRLKAYHFNGSTLDLPATENTVPFSFGQPGGMLSVSANGSSDGVLWASRPYALDANQAVVEGELRAFDASDVRRMLWTSKQNANRDNVGNFAKFVPPTVVAGKLYVPTFAYGAGLENQVTFSDTSRGGIALANMADSALALAWHGTNAEGTLNVATSVDALRLSSKVTLWEDSSLHTPALAYGDGKLYLAWTGGDGRLNLMSSLDGRSFGSKVTFEERSSYGPALAYNAGTLHMAWAGTDGGTLNVASSTDGQTLASKVTLAGESSHAAPALAAFNDTLYLLWPGTNAEHNLNLLSSTDAVSFGNKLTLTDTSDSPPALAGEGSASYLVWTGRDAEQSLNGLEGDGTAQVFDAKVTYPQQALGAPALVSFRGQFSMSWTGTDGRLNLVRINPDDARGYGRVNVYGLLDRSQVVGNIVRGGVATTEYNDSPSNEVVERAFDNDHGTKWLTFHNSAWIQYEFPAPTYEIVGYGLVSANDAPGRDPRDFRLEGSNDGSSWTLLDARTGVGPFAERNTLYKFACASPGAYRTYRLTITATNGDSLLQVSELELYVNN